jgi:hypothetical protein
MITVTPIHSTRISMSAALNVAMENCTSCGRASYTGGGFEHKPFLPSGLELVKIAFGNGPSQWCVTLCPACAADLTAKLFKFRSPITAVPEGRPHCAWHVLSSPEDLQWLRDVHLNSCRELPEFALAVIEGDADAPTAIILYEVDHVNILTIDADEYTLRLTPDEAGMFHCRTNG